MVTYFLLILLGLSQLPETTYAVGCDEPGAPEKVLREIHPGCDDHTHQFNSDCVSAIHRFCTELNYKQLREKPQFLIGVQRQATRDSLGISCMSAVSYSAKLYIGNLRAWYGKCDTSWEAQSFGCLIAAHQWCSHKHGDPNMAGIIQEVVDPTVDVGCYKVTRRRVTIATLQSHHSECRYLFSAQCYSAISRYCSKNGQFSGGVPMTGSSDSYDKGSRAYIYVGCYKAEFTGDAYFTGEFKSLFGMDTYSYLIKKRTIDHICNVKYDMDRMAKRDYQQQLQQTEYNNRKKKSHKYKFHLDTTMTKVSSFYHRPKWDPFLIIKQGLRIEVPQIKDMVNGKHPIITTSLSDAKTFEEDNTSQVRIKKTVRVKVPPRSVVHVKADITKRYVEIPFTARGITQVGNVKMFAGKWQGEAFFKLRVIQRQFKG